MTDKIAFNFTELKPDNYTFSGRLSHFLYVTNPVNFFSSDAEIKEGIKTVRHFKDLAKDTKDGTIFVTPEEKKQILRG